tara:strand:+ start:239 stop:502 length:264 start_codon:yes stop_codon:yes gene_type:complete
MAKKKPTNWGKFFRTEQDFKAMRWCLKRGIKIGPLAAVPGYGPQKFYIEIEVKGKRSRTPDIFHGTEVWQQIYKYYNYYYEKRGKSV